MSQPKRRRRTSQPEPPQEAVQLRAPTTLLRLQLTLKGRLIKSYTFTSSKDEIKIGRDPSADVFLDNPGVSRAHARIERSGSSWTLEDLGSANGTFINDEPATKRALYEGDVISVGKFTIVCGVDLDRRGESGASARPKPEAVLGTTVLSGDELAKMLRSSKEEPALPKPEERTTAVPAAGALELAGWSTRRTIVFIAAAFAVGACLGAGATWLLLK